MDLNNTPTNTFERITDEAVDTGTGAAEASPPAPLTLEQSLDSMISSKAGEGEQQVVAATAAAPTPEPVPEPTPEAVVTSEPSPAPVAEPDPSPPPAPHLSRFAELATAPLQEALPKALEAITEYAAYDPKGEDLLFRAVYEANRADIHRIALTEMGVGKDEVATFNQWVAAGKQALVMPDAPPAFPAIEDADEFGNLRLPNGRTINVQGDEGLELYDAAKFRYEGEIEKKQQAAIEAKATAERAEAERKEEARKEQAVIAERRSTYANARMDVIGKTIKAAGLNFAPEDAWMTEMVTAYAYSQVDTDEALEKLAASADPYVVANAGRAADYARDIDKKIAAITTEAVNKFSTRFLRAAKAEEKLYSREPVLPKGTQIVGGEKANLPNPADLVPTGSADDIIRQQLAAMSNSFQ
jgi:hypothetical protein